MIEWMRRYNADPRHTKKVKFYGFDIHAAPRAARVTLAYLRKVDPEQAAAEKSLALIANLLTDPAFETSPAEKKKRWRRRLSPRSSAWTSAGRNSFKKDERERVGFCSVEKGARGMKIAATPGVDATRKLYSVEFEDVVAPEADALAFNTRTHDAIESATNMAVVALCAEMLGGMQWTLETAVEYAKTREQFGKPIGVYQAVQHQLADMFLMTEGARSAVYYAAWAVSEDDPSAKLAVSVAKACCSDAAREVGARGAQVHGGIGFTWEHNLQLYYKRAKASEIMFGDANYHREEIARKVVDGDEG